jgi:hypothetical protein
MPINIKSKHTAHHFLGQCAGREMGLNLWSGQLDDPTVLIDAEIISKL